MEFLNWLFVDMLLPLIPVGLSSVAIWWVGNDHPKTWIIRDGELLFYGLTLSIIILSKSSISPIFAPYFWPSLLISLTSAVFLWEATRLKFHREHLAKKGKIEMEGKYKLIAVLSFITALPAVMISTYIFFTS